MGDKNNPPYLDKPLLMAFVKAVTLLELWKGRGQWVVVTFVKGVWV